MTLKIRDSQSRCYDENEIAAIRLYLEQPEKAHEQTILNLNRAIDAETELRKTKRLVAALAEPVPPADGEPVIYALSPYNDSGGFSPSMVPRETLPEPETREGYVTEEDHRAHVTRLQAELTSAIADKNAFAQNAVDLRKRCDDLRESLTELNGIERKRDALQSELTKVKSDSKRLAELDDQTIKQLGDRLKASESELTKAREYIKSLRGVAHTKDGVTLDAYIDTFLSNQSAPADKL